MELIIKAFYVGFKIKDLAKLHSCTISEITPQGMLLKLRRCLGEEEYKKTRELHKKGGATLDYYHKNKEYREKVIHRAKIQFKKKNKLDQWISKEV